jgi:tetratricopeptide (TPR) repeat protein
MASDYVIDTEIAIIRNRQANGENVHFYPLLLTPTPDAGLDKVKDKNLRPRDAQPFSSFCYHDRLQHMAEVANEIGKLAEQIVARKDTKKARPTISPVYVHISGLPETAYEKLRGRDVELKRLDDAWADQNSNILSLIAEGGAGKSALVNEWLTQLQADNYRGAELVLGWSFYSQGTKERATSAEQFLNWALEKLGITIEIMNATAKGDAIAEEMMKHRVLLVLDGCEPLQHGLDKQQGELKDHGLRALLRRLASTPPNKTHGLIVLTSRLAVKDIVRWRNSSAPVICVEQLSNEAGAALLRDNSVWGTDNDFKAAAGDFGGHPLALGLLASFLKEKYFGDVRQRDRIRGLLHDEENPRHDHARRVMESYEKEWLAGEAVEDSIMHLVGLFDRPASGDCLLALRQKPVIMGLTNALVDIEEHEWQRGVTRLRESRLLAPKDFAAPDALDAHPLVREWFGDRLEHLNLDAWKAAHGRLYNHLRDTTREGEKPTLEDLAPLYQAIAHGCRAMRYQEALDSIYQDRICRRRGDDLEFYATRKLGAFGADLAAISWFFKSAFAVPVDTLERGDQAWILGLAAFRLRAQGRFGEALSATRTSLRMFEESSDWRNASYGASNISEMELIIGELAAAVTIAEQAVIYADRSGDNERFVSARSTLARAAFDAGRWEDAESLFIEAEHRQQKYQPAFPMLYSLRGHNFCDLLQAKHDYNIVHDRASKILEWETESDPLLDRALVRLALGRASHGQALLSASSKSGERASGNKAHSAYAWFGEVNEGLRLVGALEFIPRGLLAGAAFRISVGDWERAGRDLEEVEEIAEPGPMKLFLCDVGFQRARLAFAKIEAFAPLNGLIDVGPPKPVVPDVAEIARLKDEAAKQLAIAADYIKTCGYHLRDAELAELEAVLHGDRRFADLPPRV